MHGWGRTHCSSCYQFTSCVRVDQRLPGLVTSFRLLLKVHYHTKLLCNIVDQNYTRSSLKQCDGKNMFNSLILPQKEEKKANSIPLG
jgi:hypothetical protein